MFRRIGRFSFVHRRFVLFGWVAVLIGVFAVSGSVGSAFSDAISFPESESRDGLDVLEDAFGGEGRGQNASIVFRAEQGYDDPEVRAAMEELFAVADSIDGLDVISPYLPGAERFLVAQEGEFAGQVAFAALSVDIDIDQSESAGIGDRLRDARPDVDGLQVEIGGQALAEFHPPESELIGLAFAVVILIVSFGSVLAMGLPIGIAVMGVGIGIALVTILSNALTIPEFATTIGAMIGLGVGIDYALFIVTRYREALHRGLSCEEACVEALDTAGRSVIFAGMTVVVSLFGLLVIGLSFVSGLGISAATTVAVTMAASITLLPAMLGFAAERVEVTRWRGLVAAGLVAVALAGVGLSIEPLTLGLPLAAVVIVVGSFVPRLKAKVPVRPPKPMRETFWYRFSRFVQHRPWTSAFIGSSVLIVMALPVLGIRLGFSDEGNFPEETTTRQAYDLLSDAFGPGFNGPAIVTVEFASPDDAAGLLTLIAGLQEADGVDTVLPPQLNDPDEPSAAFFQLIPTTSPQDEKTTELIDRLRADVIPELVEGSGLDVNVTGFVAGSRDFSQFLAERMILFFAVVLALSFVLLMVVFRSLLVPLKAVVMNMLSIAAAYGVVVAVFQWGWLTSIGGPEAAPIEPFIPMMMFAIVFGLSMDYEVFLLSRIKEEYDRTGDAVNSVADGLATTARVITAAAAIMVVVFGSFLLEDDRIIKLFGTGLATAVFLDATLVRMLLVPATMELLGARNWWLPGWLDRILPHVSVEGPSVPHDEDDVRDDDPDDDLEREPALL